MIRISIGAERDIDRVNAFYSAEGRSIRVLETERFVLAEDGQRLIGVVRLCSEEGHSILRTMRVNQSHQRQGIGKRMLECFESLVSESDCYCLPFRHLVEFYGSIGFRTIPVGDAPRHLQQRYDEYRKRGFDTVVMKRTTNSHGA